MRASLLAPAVLVLAALVTPGNAEAVVVVRRGFHPVATVAVVSAVTHPVYYAPVPTTVVVTAPAPAPAPPPPPPATEKLPVNTTMWTLPGGCLEMSVGGQTLFQCGPNYLKALPSDKGTYYAVVQPPQ